MLAAGDAGFLPECTYTPFNSEGKGLLFEMTDQGIGITKENYHC